MYSCFDLLLFLEEISDSNYAIGTKKGSFSTRKDTNLNEAL